MSYRTFSLTRERWVPCTMIPLWLDSSMALPTNWQPGQSPAMWKCRGYFPARPCWPPFVTRVLDDPHAAGVGHHVKTVALAVKVIPGDQH